MQYPEQTMLARCDERALQSAHEIVGCMIYDATESVVKTDELREVRELIGNVLASIEKQKTKKVVIKRRVPTWTIETWQVEIPAGTPDDDEESAAIDNIDGGEMVDTERDGYVDRLEGSGWWMD